MTSRFNNKTWYENVKYKKENGMEKGCIYGSPEINSKHIPINSILIVLEMNNETNKIMGIGIIKNYPICNKFFVYKNGNYNRYIYVGKYHIERDDFDEREQMIIKALDTVCFTGCYHMKRGRGIQLFPPAMIKKAKPVFDLEQEMANMFKRRFLSTEKPPTQPTQHENKDTPVQSTPNKTTNTQMCKI